MKAEKTKDRDAAMKAAQAELDRKREEARRDVPPGIEQEMMERNAAKCGRVPLLRAIAAVQAEMPILRKTQTANVGKYEYKYIPLEYIWAVLQPLLAKHGLAVTNTMDGCNMKAHVFHVETGESISCGFPIDPKLPPQSLGSAYTYARRYALCALLQIVADKDDDGAAAMDAARRTGGGGAAALDF